MSIPVVAEIIPLTRLKNDLDFFTYQIPVEMQGVIELGQLVKIPFRNKTIEGIVRKLADSIPKTEYALKSIQEIIDPLPILADWQLELIEFMSQYYLTSMAVITSMFVPDIPKRKNTIDANREYANLDGDNSKLLKTAIPNIEVENFGHALLKYRKLETKAGIIKSVIEKLEKDEQIVIIVPQLKDINELLTLIPEYSNTAVVYLNNLPISKYWQNWQSVQQGKAKIIIGTRSAIFAPFANLKQIIIDQEEDEFHKQEEPSPRYRVHTVAQWLATRTESNLLYLSQSPSVERLHEVAQKLLSYQEFDRDLEYPTVQIVDLNKEQHIGNYTPLGLGLQLKIGENDGTTLLILNKNGFATGFACRDCKTLTSFKDPSYLESRCKNCDGGNIYFVGKGVDGVAADVKNLFPDLKVQVVLNDLNILSDTKIAITTLPIALQLNISNFENVASLRFDLLDSLGDQLISERLFLDHYKIVARMNDQQSFFAQTYSPDSEFLGMLNSISMKSFYVKVLKDRQAFGLPPFGMLVRLLFRSDNVPDGEKQLKELSAKLSHFPAGVQIYPFQPMRTFFRNKTFYWSALVKVKNQEYLKFLKPLRSLPVIIDVDPIEIF